MLFFLVGMIFFAGCGNEDDTFKHKTLTYSQSLLTSTTSTTTTTGPTAVVPITTTTSSSTSTTTGS